MAPFAPSIDAPHGGARAIAQLLCTMADAHDIALVCLRGEDELPVDQAVRKSCVVVHEVTRRSSSPSFIIRAVRNCVMASKVLGGRPAWATRWQSADYARVVRDLAEKWRPDIVHIDYPVMAQYISALGSSAAPRVLVDHDPSIHSARQELAHADGFKRVIAWLNAWAWRRFARRAVHSVHTVVALTKRDHDMIERLGTTTPIATIPLATIVPATVADAHCASGTVLFVGNFMHPPNTDAALRLARDILPLVKKDVNGVRLVIVGDGPGPELRGAAGPDVEITGWVPDVHAYLNSASLVAAPLRVGGGMRVKVLEALAAGKAVVASGLAVEGLDVRDQQEVAIAETDEQFATAIVELIKDSRRRAELGRRAREWAMHALSWKEVAAAYSVVYEDLLATHNFSRAHDCT